MKKLLLTVVMLAALLLSGCRAVNAFLDDGRYTTGETTVTDKVESLDIEWASGAVEIVYGDRVSVTETANRTLDERTSLQWYLDGTTLSIRFCEPGRLTSPLNLQKTLTVTLPEGTKLGALNISSASGDVTTAVIAAQTANIDTASGAIQTELIGCETVEIDTASGNAELVLSECGDVDISSASGKIEASLTDCGSVELDSASGAVGLKVTGELRSLSVDTASGDVTLTLPETLGFTAEVDTASGKFESELPVSMSGGRYVCGDGAAALELDTASGDITIKKFIG